MSRLIIRTYSNINDPRNRLLLIDLCFAHLTSRPIIEGKIKNSSLILSHIHQMPWDVEKLTFDRDIFRNYYIDAVFLGATTDKIIMNLKIAEAKLLIAGT